ncbi:MAG: hypothetical protein AAFU85_31785 [Planctomycetota bacterium]
MLLLIGASYWRAKALQLAGEPQLLDLTLTWVQRVRVPVLIGVLALLSFCAADLLVVTLAKNNVDRCIALIITVLSLLEYINYFHVQVQHFDHAPDFKRLLRGLGFRPSKMRTDLNLIAQRNQRGGERQKSHF